MICAFLSIIFLLFAYAPIFLGGLSPLWSLICATLCSLGSIFEVKYEDKNEELYKKNKAMIFIQIIIGCVLLCWAIFAFSSVKI